MRFNFVLLTRIIGIYVLFTIDQVEGFERGYKIIGSFVFSSSRRFAYKSVGENDMRERQNFVLLTLLNCFLLYTREFRG